MIVRVSANYDKAAAQEICGEGAKHFWEVVVFTSEAKPLLVSRACSVYVDGIPLHPDNLYLAEAVELVVKGREVFINTPLLRRVEPE